jgi:gamma-glutamylcysteine synthetase
LQRDQAGRPHERDAYSAQRRFHTLVSAGFSSSRFSPKWNEFLIVAGMSEGGFLNPLREVVNRGYTRAEEMLKNYYGVWASISPLFTEHNFL